MKIKGSLTLLVVLLLVGSRFAAADVLAGRTWEFDMERTTVAAGSPRNIILMIGDGMGFAQVEAAGIYTNGEPGTLSFESLPYQGEVTTYAANDPITDSAAAATAMATGFKVNRRVISTAIPGDGRELETVLELLRDQNKSTGLVSTAYVTHATPAAFGAHEFDRANLNQIAADYFGQSRPELILGGGANGMTVAGAIAADYTVVTDSLSLAALDTTTVTMVSGQFGDTHLPYELDGLGSLPHLSEMTAVALDILEEDSDGFFLMVEGARIDHAGHDNDLQRNILETLAFADAVSVVMDWAQTLTDTLILVTADHETGGLEVLENNGVGEWPTVSWSTDYHTEVNVPIYGWGMNAERIDGVLDNTEIYDLIVTVAIDGLMAGNDSPSFQGWPTVLSATMAAGNQVSYQWSLGDGTVGEGATLSHVYPAVGVYTAVVTASNPYSMQTAGTEVTIVEPERVFLPVVLCCH